MKQLSTWLNENYIKRGGLQKSEAVKEMATDLKASYSTVYKWLKDGDYYVDILGSSIPGDDSDALVVYKQVRFIEP